MDGNALLIGQGQTEKPVSGFLGYGKPGNHGDEERGWADSIEIESAVHHHEGKETAGRWPLGAAESAALGP